MVQEKFGRKTPPSKAQTAPLLRFSQSFCKLIKKGGVASGFHHVVTNAADAKRVLQVKGRRAIKATEVNFSWSSFNKGDCFIVGLGQLATLSECNRYEKVKASQVAIDIRDNERNARAKLSIVEEGIEPEELIKALGSVTAIAPATPDDEAVETSNKKMIQTNLDSKWHFPQRLPFCQSLRSSMLLDLLNFHLSSSSWTCQLHLTR
ncbi:scinderin-like [Clarias gariepinus]